MSVYLPLTNRRSHPTRRHAVGVALAILVGVPLVLIGAGMIYQSQSEAAELHAYPPPGQMVDLGGYRLHLYCQGQGSPTVILEAAFPAQVSNWVRIQPELARITRTCAYDRTGIGWSDDGPAPRDARQHATELHALLTTAGITGPYVLIGHSLGGLYARMFHDLYPEDVIGMALIEGSHPDAWRRLGMPEGVGADPNQLAVAPALARVGFFRLGLFPVPKADADLPAQQRAEEQAYFNSARYFDTLLAVNTAFPVMLEQVRGTRDLGSKPLLVLVGEHSDNNAGIARQLQEELARLSTAGQFQVIAGPGTTHAGLVDNASAAPITSAALVEWLEAVMRK